jgi:hypothetical protein
MISSARENGWWLWLSEPTRENSGKHLASRHSPPTPADLATEPHKEHLSNVPVDHEVASVTALDASINGLQRST